MKCFLFLFKIEMVCDKCAKKLQKIIVPDTWKDGSMNNTGGEKAGILFLYLYFFNRR